VLVAIVSGWVLWHDVGVYRSAERTRLAGPTYRAAATYETEADCQVERQAAMVKAELPRGGPLTEQIPDGFMVWDPDRRYYTTFRYRCAASEVNATPFR